MSAGKNRPQYAVCPSSGFTLVTHQLRYEPYNPTCVGSSVEIPPLEHEIVIQLFYLLLYIYNLQFMRLATCYENRSIESLSVAYKLMQPQYQMKNQKLPMKKIHHPLHFLTQRKLFLYLLMKTKNKKTQQCHLPQLMCNNYQCYIAFLLYQTKQRNLTYLL